MNEAERDHLRTIWRELAAHNAWSLVTDEAAFLDRAAIELASLDQDSGQQEAPNRRWPLANRPRIALQRAYSVLLYRGIQARDQQAASELWRAILRLSIKQGWTPLVAEELAQETVTRVLEKLAQAHTPQRFLGWAIMIWRTVRRDYLRQNRAEAQLPDDADEQARQVVDPAETTAEVEQRLLSETIVAGLRATLPNQLERRTLLRIVLFGEHPRDVARDLGLPLHRTRVAKARALQRLRQDSAFQGLLRDLSGALSATGVQGDDR